MCRDIRPLFNYKPPATENDIHGASLQFVRKISGFTMPSRTNEKAFNKAVDDIAKVSQKLLDSLVTSAEPHNREEEIKKARELAKRRFG
jgi:hypothetical protein